LNIPVFREVTLRYWASDRRRIEGTSRVHPQGLRSMKNGILSFGDYLDQVCALFSCRLISKEVTVNLVSEQWVRYE